MIERLILLALAAWGLAWLISFWPSFDELRGRIGIGYVFDKEGYPIDRDAGGRIAKWFNCPQCIGLIAGALIVVWYWLGLPWIAIEAFAVVGSVQLVIRWWQGARVKAEWWV